MIVGILGFRGRVAQRHKKAWEELGIGWIGIGREEDFEEFLKSKEADIIDICTPPHLHVEQIKLANSYGYPVICEKPISIDMESAKEITKLKGKIGIIHQYRFNPKILKLKEDLKNEKYGEIKLITMNYARFRDWSYFEKWEWDKLKTGSHVLMNICIHYLDLLQWLFGYPISVRGHVTRARRRMDVEDTVTASFQFPNGAVASIAFTTYATPQKHFEMAVYGTKGSTTLQLRENEYHKDNFRAFVNDKDYVDPLEATKSLQICLDILND